MALYPWSCLLLLVVFPTVQGSSLGCSRELSEEPQCLEPSENIYYEDETYDRPCQRLGAAMMHLFAWVQDVVTIYTESHTWGDVRRAAHAILGIDIEDEDQVMELACRIQDLNTLDELIEELNLVRNRDYIKGSYRRAQLFLARIDGFHGLHQGLELMLMAHNALRQLTGREEGQILNYREVRNALNIDNLSNLFSNMEEVYGSGYLVYFLMRPYNDALVGVDHRVLAQAYLDLDIACRLGVSYELRYEILNQFQILVYTPLSRDALDIMFELYVASDQMALLNLRT